MSEETQTLTVSEYLAGRLAWIEAEILRLQGALREVKNAQALLTKPEPAKEE